MTIDQFSGFSKGALKFLKALKANNRRDWFAENKQTYEHEIKQPADAFSKAMIAELDKLTGKAHRSKIYRLYRDLRFSKDKTPYNTHLHIAFMPSSDMASPPCWFFGLDTGSLTLGTGVFGFNKAGLEAFRQRIDGSDGATLAKLLKKLGADGVRLSEPELKRVPSGYAQDHPRAGLLRRKGLSAWVDLEGPEVATRPDLTKTCRSTFKRLMPVFDWLMDVSS